MSFDTDISSKKILLAEIDLPHTYDVWINYQAGIWYSKLISENIIITDDYGVTGYYESTVSTVPSNIGSCFVDDEIFSKVTSLALCISTEKSFYYDPSLNYIYIHFENEDSYLNQIIRLGIPVGFTDKSNSNGAYYDNSYYSERIKNISSFSQKKDLLFYGIQSYQSGSIVFINSDGFFDKYNDLNIYGQPVRIKIGVDGYEYDEFEQVFEGFVEDYNFNYNDFNVKVQDKRKNLSRKIPFNQFNQDDYPNLNDEDVGKWKPVVFGIVAYMPVVCINKDEVEPDYRTFLFLDTEFGDADSYNLSLLNSFTKAYIKNDEDNNIYDQVTIADIDLSEGTIDILTTFVDNADGEARDVYMLCIGYQSSSNPITAVQILIDEFSSIAYNSIFFNTTEIASEFSSFELIGYWVQKPEALSSIIEKIMFANDGFFYVQNDGLFSMKRYDNDRASTETIRDYSWITEPIVGFNTGSFLTSVVVNASLHIVKKEYLNIYTNTDYEYEGLEKYKKYESKELDTILTNITAAENKSETVMLQAKDIVRVVKRTGDMSLYDIDLMEFITTSNKRQSEAEVLEVWEVTSKNLNLTNWTIDLEMRYIRDV